MDLNDEVELNALLGVEDYMGMEDVEEEDYESEDYESDSSDNDYDVPGMRRSVTVSAPSSPVVVEPTTTSEQTLWVSQQQGICHI